MCVVVSGARTEGAPSEERAVGLEPTLTVLQTVALNLLATRARAMREEGVEPSERVWKTRMLAVTSLPRRSLGRAVQESNPHLSRSKRPAFLFR